MTKQTFFPYPTAHDLQLQVDAVDPEHGMDPNARYLRLWETEGVEWTIRVTVDVPASSPIKVLPASEQHDPPLDLVVLLRSRTSRRREAHRLPYAVGVSSLDLTLKSDDWIGLIDVEAHLVRTNDSSSTDGRHARDRGMVVGSADPVRIDIDEPRRPPGDSLQIKWLDFSEAGIPWLEQHATNLFALRSAATTEPPVLYLNQGFEHAVAILNQTGQSGQKARTRDLVFHMIAHQVWSSVLASCLSELRDSAGEDMPLEEALEALPSWMPPVIRDWAPWLITTTAKADALDRVWEHVLKGDWEELLTEQLPNAIQSRFETFSSLTGMAQEMRL